MHRRTGPMYAALVAIVAIVATLPAALPAAAEELTLEQLLASHREARGGTEAWAAVDTLTQSGPFTAFSETGTFLLHQTDDGQVRFERDEGDDRVIGGHDGTTAWQIQPFMGDWPQTLSGADLIALEQEIDLPNPFFHLEARGYEAKLVGEAEVDGVPAIEVHLLRPSGEEETWFFDPDTHLELARDSTGSDFGRAQPMRTFWDDFREVEGLMVPHYVEQQWYTRNRVREVETVAVNAELDPALFAMPRAKGMEAYQAMAGTFTVAVESRQSPGAEMETSERTATVASRIRGGLIEEHFLTPDGTEVLRQLTYDRFRDVYRLTQINDTTTYLDIQEGGFDEEGRLVLSNLDTGSGWKMNFRDLQIRERNTITLGDQGYVIETEMTFDGGESWNLFSRETFTATSE